MIKHNKLQTYLTDDGYKKLKKKDDDTTKADATEDEMKKKLIPTEYPKIHGEINICGAKAVPV